ncbi:MAG: leucine-rich repeat domain-containing protein [Chloroherpetonaceae bacterium]
MTQFINIDYVLYLAVFFLLIALLASLRQIWSIAWKSTIGRMTRLVIRPVDENASSKGKYQVELQYEFEVDGKIQTGSSYFIGKKTHLINSEEEAKRFAADYAPDSRIVVYYNPMLYTDCALKRSVSLSKASWVFLALSVCGFYGYYILWQRDNSPEAVKIYRATVNYSIEVASRKPERAYQIDQSWRTLQTIPRELEKFPNLEVLNLSNNSISEIPKGFKFPESLVRLNLSQNKFTRIPSGLEKHPNLYQLDLSNNQIETDSGAVLPTSLRILDLSNNKLKTLSEYLARNPHLETLYVRNNQIEFLPDRLYYDSYYDKAPPALKVLDLRGNPIPPKEHKRILSQMPQVLVVMDELSEEHEPVQPQQKAQKKPKRRIIPKRWGL